MPYSTKSYSPFEDRDTMWHYGRISRQLGTFHGKAAFVTVHGFGVQGSGLSASRRRR